MTEVIPSGEAMSTLTNASTPESVTGESTHTHRALLRQQKIENEKLRHALATAKEQLAFNDKCQKDATDYRQKYFGTKLDNARLREKLHSAQDEVDKLHRTTASTTAAADEDLASELGTLKAEMDKRVREAEDASKNEEQVALRLSSRCTELTESLEDVLKSDTRMARLQTENEYRAEIDQLQESLAHAEYLEAVSELKANADLQAIRERCTVSEATCGESIVKVQFLERDKAQLLGALQLAKTRMNDLFLESEEIHARIERHGDPEELRAQLMVAHTRLEQGETRLSEAEIEWQGKVDSACKELDAQWQTKDEERTREMEEWFVEQERNVLIQQQMRDGLELLQASISEQQEMSVLLESERDKAQAEMREMDLGRQPLLQENERLRLALADTWWEGKIQQLQQALAERDEQAREEQKKSEGALQAHATQLQKLQEQNESLKDQLEQASAVAVSMLHERQDTHARLKNLASLLRTAGSPGGSLAAFGEEVPYVEKLDCLEANLRELVGFIEEREDLLRENECRRHKVQAVEGKHYNLVKEHRRAMGRVNRLIHKLLLSGARASGKSISPTATLADRIADLEELCLASKIQGVSPLRCRSISVPPLRSTSPPSSRIPTSPSSLLNVATQRGSQRRSHSPSVSCRSMPGSLEHTTTNILTAEATATPRRVRDQTPTSRQERALSANSLPSSPGSRARATFPASTSAVQIAVTNVLPATPVVGSEAPQIRAATLRILPQEPAMASGSPRLLQPSPLQDTGARRSDNYARQDARSRVSPEPVGRISRHSLSDKPSIARLAMSPKLTTPNVFRIGVVRHSSLISFGGASTLGSPLGSPMSRRTIGSVGANSSEVRNALLRSRLNRTVSNPALLPCRTA